MEYAAALGMSTDAGKAYLGRALELRYRLPRLWARVVAGELPVWRAGRIADHTISLPAAGAAHVDRHLAPVAHSCSWAQLDRLVEEALVRFDPETAEAKRRAAAESRHFDIEIDQVSYDGTVHIDGEVDLADALDLEDAIRQGAKQLADLGQHRVPRRPPLDRRRGARPPPARPRPRHRRARREPGRGVDLHVHLSEAALTGAESVGRCGNTRSPISVDQIREWCGNPDAQITVKPVIDLAEHIHVEAYEAPDRLKEQNSLVDLHCVFPYCTKPAAPLRHRPYGRPRRGRHHLLLQHRPVVPTPPPREDPLAPGPTSTLDRGTYLWTTPNGLHLIRDHHGTRHSREP